MIFKLETRCVLKKYAAWISFIIILALIWPVFPISAQEAEADGPVYQVQEGDSLWDIAQRFRISMDDLAQANGITDPNQIAVGTQLTIPGLKDVQGVLVTRTVPYGENLRSLSRRSGIAEETLARLNRVTLPGELYVGFSLIVPENSENSFAYERAALTPGQSLLELAVLHGENPWSVVRSNGLNETVSALPGDVFLLPGDQSEGPGALPGDIVAVELNQVPFLQGKVAVITVKTREDVTLEGTYQGRELHFFADGDNRMVALQGVHALAEPGYYPLTIQSEQADEAQFAFSQNVPIDRVNYPYDTPLTVDPATVDPAVTRPEDEQWAALTAPATPEKMWNGLFELPSPLPADYCLETGECWSSRFGNRRSYNGSPYQYFHTGLDVVGGVGTEIYAPAAGEVVFAGPLTVRGNATVINHGWGVYTAYMHQSEILVEEGDKVHPGQLIGYVGGTGRVQGPHLHWEIWVGGVQVDPLDWLTQSYP